MILLILTNADVKFRERVKRVVYAQRPHYELRRNSRVLAAKTEQWPEFRSIINNLLLIFFCNKK